MRAPTRGRGGGQKVLARPVRLTLLASTLARHALPLSLLVAVPLLLAAIDRDATLALRLGVSLGAMLLLLVAGRFARLRGELRRHEALAAVGLVFLLACALMIWPMMRSGLGFVDALFETVSGITTTGLTMIPEVERLPWTLQLTRAWLQWFGGLVILVLALALVIGPGAIAKRLGMVGITEQDIVSSTRVRARMVLASYCVITLATFAVLLAAMGDPLEAALHAMSAVSTGGFSSQQESLAAFSAPAVALVMLACLAGAVSIGHYPQALRDRGRSLLSDAELRTLLLLCLLGTLALTLAQTLGGAALGLGDLGRNLVTAVSAQTTSGFSAAEVAELSPASKLIVIAMMAVGGDVGSTAGGVKIFRLLIVLRLIHLLMLRTALTPHSLSHLRLSGRKLSEEETQNALGIIGLFLLVHLASWLAFLAYGYPPLDALFDVVSAVSTVGLSTGIASPELPAPLKLVLCLDMLFGRLEICALLILFMPWTWSIRS